MFSPCDVGACVGPNNIAVFQKTVSSKDHFLWYGGIVQVYLHFINHGCCNVVIAAISWGIMILSSINPWRHVNHGCGNVIIAAISWGIILSSINPWRHVNHGCGNVIIAAISWLSSINPWRDIGISTTSGN